jgi:hypothetical protein
MQAATIAAITSGNKVAPKPTAPREYRGNMCGVRVPGLPPVDGGADDPSLVLSWFYDRYGPSDRASIRAAWKSKGCVDVLLSWPDSRAVGFSAQGFAETCQELLGYGFRPCVFLCSKNYDPPDVLGILANIAPLLPLMPSITARACIGWELSLWLTPTQVQQLIDALAPPLVSEGIKVYVHFQEGYSSFQQPGGVFADFWNLQVGKLTGLLRQKILSQNPDQYRNDSGGIVDVLIRFAGNFGVNPDSGFGHPFDDIELEITAMTQFDGETTEAEGDALGTWAIETPAQSGPAGLVGVMGSGNGQTA